MVCARTVAPGDGNRPVMMLRANGWVIAVVFVLARSAFCVARLSWAWRTCAAFAIGRARDARVCVPRGKVDN
eukprot:2975395-Prymnesium_polylepis.1